MNIREIFRKFKFKISVTLTIVILEGLLVVLIPLYLGKAIEGAMEKNMSGIVNFVILLFATLVIGSLRRFYDTRTYARIYRKLAETVVKRRNKKNTSETVAHVNLINEMVEFFENSIPELLSNFIGLGGTLIIVFTLNQSVFVGCLIAMVLIVVIYLLSSSKTLNFNSKYNSEYERQVQIHELNNIEINVKHYKRLMNWKIKLSDLETINFAGVWLLLSILLSYSIFTVSQTDGLVFGTIFSLIMYVYQFMENTMNLPFYYQQSLRLKDISARINKSLKKE